jgi:NCAIR mutase (PurE)-related protein
VPTSVGYGVAEGGRLSLHSALGSCAPGVVAVNIDNGYGAACAAIRWINAVHGPAGDAAQDSTGCF